MGGLQPARLDAWLGDADPDVHIMSTFMGTELRGHEGAREWLREVEAAVPNLRFELHEVRSLGERVLVRVSLQGHGVGSDAPFEESGWLVEEFRNGKCIAIHGFSSKAEALEAVGVRL